jgi:hypothetical protein
VGAILLTCARRANHLTVYDAPQQLLDVALLTSRLLKIATHAAQYVQLD